MGHCANGGDHDFRSERQGRYYNPWSQRAVVRAKWRPAGTVIVELSLDPVDHSLFPPGTVGCCNPPAEFVVAYEFQRVTSRVLLVNIGCLTTVLEIITVVLPHERVTEAAEIDPEMRELMCEERPGVQHLGP